MMKKILYTLLALAPVAALAQTQEKTLNKQVEVTRSYEPTINDASKLNIMPKITDTLKLTPNFKYSIFSKPLESYFPVKPIAAAKLVDEPKTDLYDFFIRGGIGNYSTTLFDIYYNSPRNQDYSYGAYFKHRASTGKVELEKGPKVPTNNSKNEIALFGKKIFSSAILSGGVSYSHNRSLFYGIDSAQMAKPTFRFNKDSLTQYFNNIRAEVNLKSFYLDSTHINYKASVGYDYYNDKSDFGENHVSVGGEVFKYIQKDYLGAGLNILHVGKSGSFDTVSNTVVSVLPMLRKYGSFYTASIGVNFTNDVWGNNTKSYFFPMGHLTLDAAGSFFVPYVKVGGYLEVNSYKKITSENSFVMPGIYVENTAHKMVLSGGIKGNVSASVSYNVWGGYELIDHQFFFLNEKGSKRYYNNFNVIYDNMSKTTFGGEIALAVKNFLDIGVRAQVYSYSLDNEAKAWGMPAFESSVDAAYRHNEKWTFKASVFTVGSRYVRWMDNYNSKGELILPRMPAVKLSSFVDVNIGCEYQFTKRIHAFININNLLNSNSDTYYQYRTYGINGVVGASYSF